MEQSTPRIFEYERLVPSYIQNRARKRKKKGITNLLSDITFSWMFPILWNLRETCPEETIPAAIASEEFGERLKRLLTDEVSLSGQKNMSILKVIWQLIKKKIILAALLYIFGLAVSLSGQGLYLLSLDSSNIFYPNSSSHAVMKENVELNASVDDQTDGIPMLVGINSTNSSVHASKDFFEEFILALYLVIPELLSILLISWSWSISLRTASKFRSAAIYLLFSRLINASIKSTVAEYELVIFMGRDCQLIHNSILYAPFILVGPIVFLLFILYLFLTCYFTNQEFSPLLATIVIFIFFPLQSLIGRRYSKIQSEVINCTSQRISVLQEIFQHFRLVKMLQREEIVKNNIHGIRESELRNIKIMRTWDNLGTFTTNCITIIVALLLLQFLQCPFQMLSVFLLVVFVALKDVLMKWWLAVKLLFGTMTSFNRLKDVMLLEKAKSYLERPIDLQQAVCINEASFEWRTVGPVVRTNIIRFTTKNLSLKTTQNQVLTNISLNIPKGNLVGICGVPGSGKTSLLLAILGELQLLQGQITRNGSCAWVGKSGCVWNISVKDNIVLKGKFNNQKYYRALHSCGLLQDIAKLPEQDSTILEDNLLSTGFKQRISLAQAIYADRDIYLLDEPLQWMDASVVNQVFETAILKGLNGKTVIMATNKIKFLSRCDQVFLMDNGQIVESGCHEKLLNKNAYYSRLIQNLTEENNKSLFMSGDNQPGTMNNLRNYSYSSYSLSSISSCATSTVMKIDLEQSEKHVEIDPPSRLSDYLKYGSSFYSTLWIILGLLIQILKVGSISSLLYITFYISNKSTTSCLLKNSTLHQDINSSSDKLDTETHLNVVCLFSPAICFFISGMLWIAYYSKISFEKSKHIHSKWIQQIIKASMEFLNSESIINILNWFSLHMWEIDMQIPFFLGRILESTFAVIFLGIILCYSSTWLILPLAFLIVVATPLCCIFIGPVSILYNMTVETCKPLYKDIITVVKGRTAVQVYSKEKIFIDRFVKLCDKNATYTYFMNCATGCLNFALQISKVSILFVMLPISRYYQLEFYMGLIIICIFQATSYIYEILISIFNEENAIASFEINSKIKNVKNEDSQPVIGSDLQNWDGSGNIEFKKVKLKNWIPVATLSHTGLTFKIQENSTVGIFGSSSCGKMKVADALFGLVKLSQGKVLIGTMDIAKVPLEILRSKVAIVPENPVLFDGTIRTNIDPDKKFKIQLIKDALIEVGLYDTIERMSSKFDTQVNSMNNSLSVGECQLLYLARAKLLQPKILIVEEPLEFVDSDLKDKLLRTLQNFKCTIILIAHQPMYLHNCDRIIVLKDGEQVIANQHPKKLIEDPNSVLWNIVERPEEIVFETQL